MSSVFIKGGNMELDSSTEMSTAQLEGKLKTIFNEAQTEVPKKKI